MKRKIKFLLIFLLFLFVFGGRGRVKAEDLSPPPEFSSPLNKLKENISSPQPNLWQWLYGKKEGKELNENGVVPGIENAFLGQLAGVPDEKGQSQGGALNLTAKMIASIYANPPASGIYYAYDVLHNLGIAPAYAANGVGFSGLQPILPIWKAFRNIAYAVFALIFIVTGLMIMFRVKISPQAVLTIENALPKLIGTLILITFSYAIAGFMIDLMYVFMGLVINVVLSQPEVRAGVLGFYPTSEGILKGGIGSLFPPLVAGFQGAAGLGSSIGYMMGRIIPSLGGLIIGGISGIIGGVLFSLIWIVIAVFLFFKLVIALIKTYVNILMLIIFSPLQIMAGAFPQSPAGFASWLKNLAANLLVFPTVAVLSLIAVYIIEHGAAGGGGLWTPPLMGPGGPDLILGSDWVASIFAKSIVGMGMLLVLPSVPDIVRAAFGIKESGIGAMIGGVIAPVAGVIGFVPRQVAGIGQEAMGKFYSDKAIKGMFEVEQGKESAKKEGKGFGLKDKWQSFKKGFNEVKPRGNT